MTAQQSTLGARLSAQLLSGSPAGRPEAVPERLLAVQAQDPRAFRLAIRCRSEGLTSADVDDALGAHRSLVVTWLNRGTLHLVTTEDYWWLRDLTAPTVRSANARRLRQEGVVGDALVRGLDLVSAAVAEGPQTRAALRDRLDAAGVPTRGQALVHVLMEAALLGHVVRGPVVSGREQAWVSVPDWLGSAPARLDRDEGLARLAGRYLRGHGPATEADLARWAGVPLRDARGGLGAVAGETEEVGDGLVDLVDRPGRAHPGTVPPPRLLGAFDPVLLGWVSREDVVGRHASAIVSGGVFRPFALVDGRAVATWRLVRDQVELAPLEPLDATTTAALVTDGHDALRFLGLPDA